MKEPKENVVLVHEDYYEQGRFQHPLEWFVGKLVKLGLGGEVSEFMWVQVQGIVKCPNSLRQLLGELHNDPVTATDFANGDMIAFWPEQVVEVK